MDMFTTTVETAKAVNVRLQKLSHAVSVNGINCKFKTTLNGNSTYHYSYNSIYALIDAQPKPVIQEAPLQTAKTELETVTCSN